MCKPRSVDLIEESKELAGGWNKKDLRRKVTDYRQPPTQEDLEIIYDLPDEDLIWCGYCSKYVDPQDEEHNHEGNEDDS